MLASLDISVLEAEDGLDGLEKIKIMPLPDLILLDWNMPNMNGYEFLQAIKKNSAYNKILVLMVTTENEMSQVVKALEAGADEYIMKPFEEEALKDKLKILGLNVG
jgi:two-component system chemotaxis response regulator CheY